jgi:hypothetical protein
MIFYQIFFKFFIYSFNLKKYIKLINYTYKYFTLLFLNIKYDYHKFLSILIILLIDYFLENIIFKIKTKQSLVKLLVNLKMTNDAFIAIIIDSIYSVLGGCFNLIVIIVYIINYKTYISIFTLLMLSIINFIASTVLIPFDIIQNLELIPESFEFCSFINFLLCLFNTQAFLLLALISFERFQNISSLSAANRLIKSRTKLTNLITNKKFLTLMSFVISVLFATASIFLHTFKDNKYELKREASYLIIGLAFLILIVFIVICYMYLKIYILVRNSSIKIASTLFRSNKQVNSITSNVVNVATDLAIVRTNRTISKSWRTAKIFLLVN